MADPRFDEIIHASLRLRICSLLAAADSVAFSVVRDTLEVTDPHLSKQVRILSDAGYVTVSKEGRPHRGDARKTAWLSLTDQGRRAYEAHVGALKALFGPS